MYIVRQHDSTTIPELVGAKIMKLLGVGPSDGGCCFFYMLADETWYRFFIQCEILFWATSDPDPEDDLEGDPGDSEEYIDVAAQVGLRDGATIRQITMLDGCFTIELEPDWILHFREDKNTAVIIVTKTKKVV